MRPLARYRYTLAALFMAALLYITSLFLDMDIFEQTEALLRRLETVEADEIIVALLLVVLGLAADFARRHREKDHQREIAEQKLATMKATLHTVQDIFNNFLQILSARILWAQEGEALSPQRVHEIEQLIANTAARLNSLTELERAEEVDLGAGIRGIRPPH